MLEFRAKLGGDGRIIIPAICRKEMDFEPGEELILRMENHQLRLFSLRQSVKNAQERVQQYTKNVSLVKKLKQARKEDFENE